MATELLTPILNGIKNINYFEGRLLSARDLREQEEANRASRWSLGKAIGAGIVDGLQVNIENRGSGGTTPVVKVTGGTAINAKGQVLELAGDSYKIALSKSREVLELNTEIFRVCEGLPDAKQIPNGSGVYLLIISPTAIYRDFAPKSGLLAEGENPECGRRYIEEGIQFRLEQLLTTQFDEIETPLDVLASLGSAPADVDVFKAVSQLRNGIAHAFFKAVSAESAADKIRDTESAAFSSAYSALDLLIDNKLLSDCDVPLALLYWDPTGIRFLDMWSVRRLARWMPSTDEFSLIQSYGLERLMQFQDHIDELLESALVLEQFEIQELFRYVPPATYIPVNGANSDNGFDASDFIQAYFRPPLNEISTGLFADVLKKSLHLPAVDLQTHAYLHTYQLVENEAALDNDDSHQRYYVICGNDTADIRVEDGLVVAFETAWSVYGGLLKRRIFIPPATDPDKIVAVNSLTNNIRNVMDMANRQASIAASNVLNYNAALKAYRWLYDAQSELAAYFQTTIPGIVDTQGRESFGAELERLLDGSLDSGAHGLDPALQAENLVAAIDAQNAINTFVGSWSGEGIALGPFGIISPESPEGRTLVPGADPIPQVFTLFNGTDKALTFNLQAELEPVAVYSQPKILDSIGGDEIDSLPLVSGARTTIVAMVSAPLNGVSIGDKPLLIMTASVPAPTNRTSRNPYPDFLKVGIAPGNPVEGLLTFADIAPNFVLFDPSGPPIDPDAIVANQAFSIALNTHYENENLTPRTFTVKVMVTASSAIAGWTFGTPINFGSIDENVVDTTTRIYSYNLQNQTPGTLPFTVGVGVMANTPGATDIDIDISIASSDSEPPISADYGTTISLSMK